jgi:hypothetical protein
MVPQEGKQVVDMRGTTVASVVIFSLRIATGALSQVVAVMLI